MTDLLFQKTIHKSQTLEIEETVASYFEFRQKLYPERPMWPKDHFAIHSKEVIESVGPIANLTCMRDEARHQNLLAYAKASKNKIDVAFSTAHKVQIAQAFYFRKQEVIKHKKDLGPPRLHKFESWKIRIDWQLC